MNSNLKPSSRVAVVGVIDPDLNAAGTYTTDWIDMSEFGSILAIVLAGAITAAGTVDAKIEQASDGAGTGAKDIADRAITQLTQAGGDDDKQALINVFQSDLDIDNGFTHLRLSLTTADASADSAGLVLGLDPVKGAANENDAASVAEIVG